MPNTTKNTLPLRLKCLILLETFNLSLIPILLNNINLNKLNLNMGGDDSLQPLGIMIFGIITMCSFLALGLYNTRSREAFKGVSTRIIASVVFGIIVVAIASPTTQSGNMNLTYLSLLTVCSIFSICIIRSAVRNFDLFGLSKKSVLVIGAGNKAAYLEKRMRRNVDRLNFRIHGYISCKGDNKELGIQNETILNIKQDALVIYALENNIDEIVVAPDEPRQTLQVDELFASKVKGINVIEISDFIEREIQQIPTEMLPPSKVLYSNGFSNNNHLRNAFDWLFNAMLSLMLFLIAWPFLLITAIMIKLEDGWNAPVFYKQERVGSKGCTFNILKFRSMKIDAEINGAQMSSKNDNRITRVGSFIRKVRIDELPQILNIMSGEMGFVGPRPERPVFVNKYINKYHYFDERHNVKPGLTGWAQLKYPYGDKDIDSHEKLKFDLYYIKHRSFTLDILILVRTVEVVLFGKGR